MVFITRYSANLFRLARLAVMAFFLLATAQVQASGIDSQKAVALFIENRIEISSHFSIQLSPVLEQSLQNGLVLPFQLEFQLTKPRFRAWMRQLSDWLAPAEAMTIKLGYQALTRQYRVSSGGLSRTFNTLHEALAALGIVSGWQILAQSDLAKDPHAFAGQIRLRLDLAQLPKPYQLAAIGQSDWHISSSWTNLSVTLAEASLQ